MEQQPVQLVITVMPNGEVQLSGPINNKVLCYGALLLGYEALLKYHSRSKDAGPALAIAQEMPHG